MENLLQAFVALIVLCPVLCHECFDEDCSSEEKANENVERLGLANNDLAFKLYEKLASATDENIFFSPFAMSVTLSLLYMGAEGETAQELRKLLAYRRSGLDDRTIFDAFHQYLTEASLLDSEVYTLSFTSAIVAGGSIHLNQDYKNKVEKLLQARVVSMNVNEDSKAAVEKLNAWVQKRSKGTISSVVDAVDPSTTLLLVSAAYFRGSWRVKFDPFDTKYHVFFNNGNSFDKSDILMMHAAGTYRFYEEEDEFSAIELMYEGKNVSMMIFLPRDVDGLSEMEETMSPGKISLVRRYMYHTKVHLTLPKLKLSFDRDLSPDLQELGLKKAFCADADFSGMSESAVAVDDVRHTAVIEVDEKGSVAAGMSSVVMTKMIPISEATPEFRADHPFLLAIVDTRTGLLLFMGRVNKL